LSSYLLQNVKRQNQNRAGGEVLDFIGFFGKKKEPRSYGGKKGDFPLHVRVFYVADSFFLPTGFLSGGGRSPASSPTA
jgi:hypothetical protein